MELGVEICLTTSCLLILCNYSGGGGEPHNSCPGEIFPACWSDGNISGCSGAAVCQLSSPHAPKKTLQLWHNQQHSDTLYEHFFFSLMERTNFPSLLQHYNSCYCYLRQELVLHPKRAVTRTTPRCNYDTQAHSRAGQKHRKCSAGSNVVGVPVQSYYKYSTGGSGYCCC